MVIALFTALIAPFFVDWTAHRAAFEREVSRIIGQPVKVSGRASVRILPLPSVTFSDLSVGEYADGSPMMTVESFTMLAELMPLMTGDLKIVEVRLVRPHAVIRVNDNGTIDWTERKETLVDPDKVEIESLLVEDGRFEIEGLAGGRRITGTNFQARVSAQALTGPWRIAGKGDIGGSPTEYSLTTGKAQDDGAIRVGIEARRLDQPYRVEVDGPVKAERGLLGWNGTFLVAPVTGKDGKRDPAALPIRVAGDFKASPDAVAVPKYQLDIGRSDDPYTITGKATVEIREQVAFRIEADGRQIDLDHVAKADAEAGTGAGVSDRFALVRSVIERIPVPAASGEIDFELPAIVAGDTVIREVSALVRPAADGWTIERLRSTLPGNTAVEASGRLSTGAEFGFSGRMLVASRQPTGFANWLSGRSSAALRRLRTAGFSGDVTLTANQTSVDNLELSLDGVTMTGSLKRLAPAGERPAILADLAGAEVDVDDLKALLAFAGEAETTGWRGHDLDLALSAGLLLGEGMEARDANARLRVVAGSVSLDRLDIEDFYGSAITSSGNISDLAQRPSGNFSVNVKAADGSGLVALMRERLGPGRFLDALSGDAALVSDVDLTLAIDSRPQGETASGTVTLKGRAGGTDIDASNRFEGAPARWWESSHAVSASLANPRAEALARQLSLPVLPVEAGLPLSIAVDATGRLLDAVEASLSASSQGSDLSYKGTLRFEKQVAGMAPDLSRPIHSGTLTIGSADIDPFLMMFGQALPGAGEGTPLSLAAAIAGSGGEHRLDDLSGQYAGNGFSGRLSLKAAVSGPAEISGELALDTLSLPVLGELALGAGTLSGEAALGQGGAPEFAEPGIAPLSGSLALSADRLATGFSQDGSGVTARLSLADGSAALQDITAQWLGGRLAASLSLKNAGGDATLNIQATLGDADGAKMIETLGLAPFLRGASTVSLSADAQGRSLAGLVSGLSGSGTLSIRDGVLVGVEAQGLPAVLADADAEGFEVSVETVAPLVEAQFLKGEAPFGEAGGAFALSAGRVLIRNLSAEIPGGRVAAEAGADMGEGSVEASLALSPDPGKDALAGAEPAVTVLFSGEPGNISRTLDTTALEGFLSLRAFEREQRRVEVLQASVIERQRLRREVMASNARIAAREAARRAEEEARRRAEEEARQKAEAAAQAQATAGEATKTGQGAKPGQGSGSVKVTGSGQAAGAPGLPGVGSVQSKQLFDNIEKLLGE